MSASRKKVQLFCTDEEDRTKQSFKAECDMNNIVSRIYKTGFVPLEAQASLRRQIYGDASAAPQSLEEAYAIVHRADAAFAALPAALRERFRDPAGLLSFVDDPANLSEAQTLGLIAKVQPSPVSGPKTAASELPAEGEAPAAAAAQAPGVGQ